MSIFIKKFGDILFVMFLSDVTIGYASFITQFEELFFFLSSLFKWSTNDVFFVCLKELANKIS